MAEYGHTGKYIFYASDSGARSHVADAASEETAESLVGLLNCIPKVRDLCEEGTQAQGDEFYGRILNILDGKSDDWQPEAEDGTMFNRPGETEALDRALGDLGEVEVGTFHGQVDGKLDLRQLPLITEAAPASGATAVALAAESAARAFDNISNVEAPLPEPSTSDLGGELAKSPAERLAPLPQEGRAKGNAGEFDEKV